ncbi:hypothetical protein [Polyangium mundeleinium]|uniref:Uncharacterized protein n=1 Tax=Polyangium mundeleinium TaxID=2995306 RepID=A0ABT5EXU3_9BACT|nr:hypothetical protein [Polyangium mundeleinium]MDC0746645.1 hypothetical protein [Polyangium mundeleinium]
MPGGYGLPAIALDGDRVVYATYEGVFRVPLAGGCPTSLHTFENKDLNGVKLSVKDGVAYVGTDASGLVNGVLGRVPVQGGAFTKLLDFSVYGLFVTDTEVVATGFQGQDDRLMAVPLAGGTPKVAATGLDSPREVVVVGDKAYWADVRTNQQDTKIGIYTAPLVDGGNEALLYGSLEFGLNLGSRIRTDGEQLYVQTGAGDLLAAKVNGSGTSLVLEDNKLGFFTVDGADIYAQTSAGIVKVATSGGTPTIVVADANAAAITVGEKDVVWFDAEKNQLLRAPK